MVPRRGGRRRAADPRAHADAHERQVRVIDCAGHLLGRLCSVVAKQLLLGQKVVLVRTEQIYVSGGLVRQKMKWARYRRLRTNTKPAHGPFHQRAPARFTWRVVRGMIPHKTKRGTAAMERLKCYEGIPAPYDKVKKVVVPDAIKVTHLQFKHKSVRLDQLCTEIGWKHKATIETLEAARKERALEWHRAKAK